MLFVAAAQFIQRQWLVLFSVAMGLVMIGWEIAEIAMIDRFPQAVVRSTVVQQTLYSALGLVIVG